MTAYIEATGCNWVLDFPAPKLDTSADANKQNIYISWMRANSMITRSITTCLSGSLKAKYQDKQLALELIVAIRAEYASPGISGTFALFKELLKTKIASSSRPVPSVNKVATLFAHLESAGYAFPANIQAMLLLAKLPFSMTIVTQIHNCTSKGCLWEGKNPHL